MLGPKLTPVPANDFAAQWEVIREDALGALDRVGRSGQLILGEEVEALEAALAKWWDIRHVVGVGSGLDALEIALRCAGVDAGARVLTTPLTAFATTIAILRVGAEPVWCDVDSSGSLDLDLASEVLANDSSIRAVVPVHLYGHPLNPLALSALADQHGVIIIEDCAQSAGAIRNDRRTGQAGSAAASSLYPTKNLGALGDGGFLITSDDSIAHCARTMRNYGQEAHYRHVRVGLNSRLDEVQAAILRSALLPRLDDWLRRRAEIATRYTEALRQSRLRPILASGGVSANHLYPVEDVEGDPAATRRQLASRGISVGRHYPVLCPDQPASAGVGAIRGSLDNARRLSHREISLPIHPQLGDAAVEQVIDACLEGGQ